MFPAVFSRRKQRDNLSSFILFSFRNTFNLFFPSLAYSIKLTKIYSIQLPLSLVKTVKIKEILTTKAILAQKDRKEEYAFLALCPGDYNRVKIIGVFLLLKQQKQLKIEN